MGCSSGPDIIQDGLVLCLDAASKRSYVSGNTWTDLKSGYNATLVNGPTFRSDNGGILRFDGTNQRADLSVPHTFSAISMLFFIKYRSPQNTGWKFAIDTFTNGNTHRFTFHSSTNGGTNMAIWMGGGADLIMETYPLDEWVCHGATWDGSNLIAYKNGENIASTTKTRSSFSLENTIGIAARYQNGYYNNLDFGNILIYDHALTADEVRQNYLSTKERFA
jgi:hypothetical protein